MSEYEEFKQWQARTQRARERHSNSGALIGWAVVVCVGLLIGAAVLVDMFPKGGSAADAKPQPTLSAIQRNNYQQQSDQTASEQQVIKQAEPKEDTSKPPQLPVQATAAAIVQPSSLDSVPAGSLSTTDLTNRPIPTPTTMLTEQQFADSQASEEVNYINNQLQGLTPAQQMVRQHDAEWNASHP